MPLDQTMKIAGAGMKVQSARLRVTAENLANAESTAATPGGEPYRRKTVAFANELDRALGVPLVRVAGYGIDPGPLPMRFEPGHPAADEDGYVKLPNVNPLIELMDMREAHRSYEANVNALELAKAMARRTLELLR